MLQFWSRCFSPSEEMAMRKTLVALVAAAACFVISGCSINRMNDSYEKYLDNNRSRLRIPVWRQDL
jgi:hypothetical protein